MKTWIARHRGLAIGALAAIVVVVAIVLVVALGDDDDAKTAATTSSTPSTSSTTSAPSTTTTTVAPSTTAPAPFDPALAVWPFAASPTRYRDPVGAATGFAVDLVGFKNPIVGKFRPATTNAGAGEVDVGARANGPATTVALRRLATDGTWWVLGATTPNIELSEPAALASISSPVRLRGRSTAFEGTVQTELRRDGARHALVKGFVMGGATGTLEPFTGTLTFSPPAAAAGAVVLYTASAESGEVEEATVVRVTFAAPGG